MNDRDSNIPTTQPVGREIPSLREVFAVIALTVAAMMAVVYVFAFLSSFFRIGSEFLLAEVIIIIPAVIYIKLRDYSIITVFRLKGINYHQLLPALVMGISAIIIINYIETITQLIPLPDAFMRGRAEFEQHLLESLTFTSMYQSVVLITAVVVVAAISEEMLFRGLIQQSLEHCLPRRTAIVITAFAFTILHPFSLVPIFLFALVLGITTLRSNSIVPAMLIHALFNGLSLYAINTSEDIRKDPTLGIYVPPHLLVIAAAAFIYSFIYFWRITENRRKPEENSSIVQENRNSAD